VSSEHVEPSSSPAVETPPSPPPPHASRWRTWQEWFDRLADVPFGILAFLAIIFLMATRALNTDQVAALMTGSGLLAVGHGVHRHGRQQRPPTH